MKLPATRIADKLKNGLIAGSIVTVITTIANSEPLKNSDTAKLFQSPEFVTALLTISFGVVGYQTKETAYNDFIRNIENNSQTVNK